MKLHRDNAFKTITTDAFKNVLEFEPTDESYDQFIDKSIDTVDSFGLGIALMFVLHRSRHLLADDFYKKLGALIGLDMLHPRLFIRSTPDQLLAKYEDILTSSGLLEKHNKHIENHLIANNVSDEMKVAAEIADSTVPALVIDADDAATLLHNTEIIRDCPVDKEFNPLTKRCVNVCGPGQVRNPDFKCVNPVAQAACPDGFELNPRTRRCVKACKAGQVRNADFKCVSGRGTRKTKKTISPIVAKTVSVPSLLDTPVMTFSDLGSKQWASALSDNWSKTRSKHSVKTRSKQWASAPSDNWSKTRSKTRSKQKLFSRHA
jgi:hypothetical protein